MRACYVLLEFPVLSQTFVTDEIDALTECGHTVITVSMEGGPGADIALGARRTRSAWVLGRVWSIARRRPAAVAQALRRPHLTLGMRVKILAAAEEARRRGADCVHAHFAYRNADAAEIIGIALGTGHSVTVHAHDIFVERRHLRRRLGAARKVITVCRYNRDHIVSRYPEVSGRISVIPCSTRVRPEARTPVSADDVPVLLSVGRMVEKKGFDDLILACSLVDRPFRLVVIGDGPLRSRLQAMAERLGVAGRVSLLGALDHAATLEWYARADIFVLACKVASDGDRDSMPVVTKEAMAAGLPVVSTEEVGVPEMVDDGKTGLLVPPSDPAALAAGLVRLIDDPGLRKEMGRLARQAIADRFDIRDQAEAVAHTLSPVSR